MEMLKTSLIKPDPNQPRRTFNEEKMASLTASMEDDGFRKEYPLIINGGNIIVDGERRWRAATAAGIKEVPVERKENVEPWERKVYQLQSEGAELESADKLEAWYDVYEESGKTYDFLAKKFGVTEGSFKTSVGNYKSYLKTMEVLTDSKVQIAPDDEERFWPMSVIGREKDVKLRKKLAEKAVKEDWTTDKARDIRKAIKENPLKEKQIMDMDYADPWEGSSQWKRRLEVAKSDIDVGKLREDYKTLDQMETQIDSYDKIIEYMFKAVYAMGEFNFDKVTPQVREKLEEALGNTIPSMVEYHEKLKQSIEASKNLKKLEK